jgi:hypothetical protein
MSAEVSAHHSSARSVRSWGGRKCPRSTAGIRQVGRNGHTPRACARRARTRRAQPRNRQRLTHENHHSLELETCGRVIGSPDCWTRLWRSPRALSAFCSQSQLAASSASASANATWAASSASVHGRLSFTTAIVTQLVTQVWRPPCRAVPPSDP